MNNIKIHEDGEANHYTLVGNNTWIATIHLNGEYTIEQQREILKKITKALEK